LFLGLVPSCLVLACRFVGYPKTSPGRVHCRGFQALTARHILNIVEPQEGPEGSVIILLCLSYSVCLQGPSTYGPGSFEHPASHPFPYSLPVLLEHTGLYRAGQMQPGSVGLGSTPQQVAPARHVVNGCWLKGRQSPPQQNCMHAETSQHLTDSIHVVNKWCILVLHG
jgi:hypothetical protein